MMKKRSRNRKVKLATLLTSLVSLSVIFTIIILLCIAYQSEKEFMEETHLSLNYSKAEKMSEAVDSLIGAMKLSLENLATYVATNELTDEQTQAQLELLLNNSTYFNSLTLVDDKGIVQNIAPLSVGLKGKSVNTGVTKEVLEGKRPSLSVPYIAPTGRLIVLLSHPVYKEGEYKGMIAGTIYLHEESVLNNILGNDIVEENGSYYYVVGPEGNLLFHPSSKRIGESVSGNKVVQKIMTGNSGKKLVVNTKGVPMLAAYSVVPETGWGVVQQTPVSAINEMLYDHIKKLILYMLPPFLLLLFISIAIARKLAEPFKNLAELVNDVAQGKEVTVPEGKSHWNLEADLLTKSAKVAIDAVKTTNNKLLHSATMDALTEIPNRRKLNETMDQWASENRIFSLLVLDIDRFKIVNDTYGHQEGDKVLIFLAETMKDTIRKNDLCFRYGGEEFVVLLSHTTSAEAFHVAEKLREKLANTISPIGEAITISIGIAEFPSDATEVNELFSMADKALYQSKLEGRNKTTLWTKGRKEKRNSN
jgi:diguanylate cyclase (GGDEF)-like protein